MRIAIDFDEVILDKNGKILDGAIITINHWHAHGHQITIFTTKPDWERPTIIAVLGLAKIPFDRVICGKPSYDLFIDDKAVKFEGWNKNYDLRKDI